MTSKECEVSKYKFSKLKNQVHDMTCFQKVLKNEMGSNMEEIENNIYKYMDENRELVKSMKDGIPKSIKE